MHIIYLIIMKDIVGVAIINNTQKQRIIMKHKK